jgi:hypothetical protein
MFSYFGDTLLNVFTISGTPCEIKGVPEIGKAPELFSQGLG